MIKTFLGAMALASTLFGSDSLPSLFIRMEGEPLVTCKLLQQTLTSMGIQSEIRSFATDQTVSEIELGLIGKKGYDTKRFIELLKERSVVIIATKIEKQRLSFDLDMREGTVDLPVIDEDSSSQMQRSTHPYWFDVERARYITIDAPYEGSWYPEIAVMNQQMEVLHSSRGEKAQERMVFELPQGSKYLKVSNGMGMHMMKEGLWVSAEQNEN